MAQTLCNAREPQEASCAMPASYLSSLTSINDANNRSGGSIRIGSFEELTWRMDPDISFSDWCLEIVRVNPGEDQTDNNNRGVVSKRDKSEPFHRCDSPKIDYYHVHRNILAVGPRHSEYFAAQFQAPMQERHFQRTVMRLEDSRADVVPLVLDFLYLGVLPDPLTPPSAAALHSLSEYLNMPLLRTQVEDYYRTHVTMANIVDFIQHAQGHYAEPLLRIAVETSVKHLLQMTTDTARQLGPDLLLDILETNAATGTAASEKQPRRRYGFHASQLVAECCHCHKESLSEQTFRALTDIEILPYLDATAAIYLLSMEIDVCNTNPPVDDTSEQVDGNTSKKQVCQSACLHQRCTQAIVDKWGRIRKYLLRLPKLKRAFERIPSLTLIQILMKTTSPWAVQAMADDANNRSHHAINDKGDDDNYNERESPNEAPPRILVQHAGIPTSNGLYALDGRLFQGVPMYSRPGEYQDESCVFAIFQCLVRSKTKRWFISAIPPNGRPGTNKDVDFYSALVTEDCLWVPPTTGWKKSSDGDEIVPTLLY